MWVPGYQQHANEGNGEVFFFSGVLDSVKFIGLCVYTCVSFHFHFWSHTVFPDLLHI